MPLKVDSSMKTITMWNDVEPFTDRIVAYKSEDSYFASKNEGYTIDNTYFGYINGYPLEYESTYLEKTVYAYGMSRIKKPEDNCTSCILADLQFKSIISMRLANKEELEQIQKAIDAKEVKFEYIDDFAKIDKIVKYNLRKASKS